MSSETEDAPSSPEIHFEPVVKLPLVETKTMEEDEDELVKLRARLYRFDNSEQPPEWKERGTGNVKILKNTKKGTARIVMRREKTLKICANHYIMPYMDLKPSGDNDRVWLWSTPADYADEEVKPELLAMKFQNAECAQKFKAAFEEAKKYIMVEMDKKPKDKESSVTEKLEALHIKDAGDGSDKEAKESKGGDDGEKGEAAEKETEDVKK